MAAFLLGELPGGQADKPAPGQKAACETRDRKEVQGPIRKEKVSGLEKKREGRDRHDDSGREGKQASTWANRGKFSASFCTISPGLLSP